MATVGKETAGREIARCRTAKQPRMFCIASYVNTHSGQTCYKLCFTAVTFVEMMTSPFVERVIILWQSEDYKHNFLKLVSEAHRTLGA